MKHFLFCILLSGLLCCFHVEHTPASVAEDPDVSVSTCLYAGEKEMPSRMEFSVPSHKPTSEVELNTSYTFGLQYTAFSRVKRSISMKYMHFLKTQREENRRFMSEISHQKEQLHVTTYTPSSSSVSTYYVYGLRHILI